MRVSEAILLGLVVVQAIGGLGAACWRSTRRQRRQRGYIDLTDLTSISRSTRPR
jgi:hypothetical protein